MRMVRTGIHFDVPKKFSAESVLREHPLNGMFDRENRFSGNHLFETFYPYSPRIAGMPIIFFCLPFSAGQTDLICIYDYNIIPDFLVRSEDRLMLSPENRGYFCTQLPEYDILSIDNIPFPFNILLFCEYSLHYL